MKPLILYLLLFANCNPQSEQNAFQPEPEYVTDEVSGIDYTGDSTLWDNPNSIDELNFDTTEMSKGIFYLDNPNTEKDPDSIIIVPKIDMDESIQVEYHVINDSLYFLNDSGMEIDLRSFSITKDYIYSPEVITRNCTIRDSAGYFIVEPDSTFVKKQ